MVQWLWSGNLTSQCYIVIKKHPTYNSCSHVCYYYYTLGVFYGYKISVRIILSFADRNIFLRFHKTWICRPHDLISVDQLLHAMSTPSYHTADGKKRGV